MKELVCVERVTKRYQRGRERVEVLYRVSLTVGAGEFLVLMGPSGSGKTTLLNLIGGLDTPDAGSITVAGQRLDLLRSGPLSDWRARHIGFIFQFYNLLPAVTAERNVEMPLLLSHLPRVERRKRVAAALALVGLPDRAAHTPDQLSGGEQQRVAIARALVANPTLLICDEPTGDLDRQNSDAVLDLLQLLNQRGTTIVLVTHDPLVAARASRRVVVDKGALVDERAEAAA